jgi:hypothetical protein
MRKILFVLYAILLVLALSSAIQACDPLIDPDCGSDPTDPPCIGCTAPTCGNGIINSGEQCERPSTGNNVYCLQSNHQCSGKLYGSRDSYGNCNSACGCSYDSFNYVCSVGNCGAECDSANACPSTECDNLDGCAGLDYYDYSDVSNSCSSGCACSRNACTAPTIIRNDARCAPKPVCSGSDSYYLTRFSPSSCTNSSGTFSSYCSGNAAYMRGCNSGSGLCVVTSGLDCTSYNMLCSGGYCSVCKSGYDWIDPYDHSKGCKEIVYECTYDSECDKLDSSYCVGDSSFHVEGKCVNRACVSGTPVLMQNCNSADRNFCVGSVVKNDNGYCSSGYCYVSTTTVRECNDNLFCNGVESCSAGSCVLGSSVNCAGSNIAGVASCFNVPDGNSKTWDYRASFTSSCNEASDSCTSGSSSVSSACSVLSCNAECDSTHSCAATDCSSKSGCVGSNYYIYSNVANSCLSDCGCSHNSCSSIPSQIIYNDSRCVSYECTYDSECDRLDSTYCSGDSVYRVDGKCINRACVSGTPVLMQNCNSADRNFCVGSVVKNDNGYCSSGYCYVSTTTVQNCNDGLFCNGVESCSAGSCVSGSSVNCAGSNIAGVASCFNVPDGNSKTWDYRASFTSSCNEASDSCNSGSSVVSSACSVLSCNAECDSTHSCASTRCTQYSGCIGRDYYVYSDVSNSCTGSCACTSNSCSAPVVIRNDSRCGECSVNSDCDRLDSNFCTGSSVFRSEGVCISGMCASGTPALVNNCNDGLFCNGVESCSAGSCVSGSDVSCSEFNVPGIAACNNVPDGNPRTWDYRASFISSCNEAADSCTQSSSSAVISTCDKTRCGASCSAGEAETRACGFGGSQSRACTSCCLWNAWSNCTGEGECVSGAVENKPCGNCGTSSRVCSSEYQWNAWSACSDEGVCAEGSTQSEKCGFMLTGTRARECSSSCAWNSWGNCTGEGECNPGETEERGCEINSYSGIETRKCLSNFRWGVWSRCTIPSEKIDINMLRIINEDCVMPGEEIIAALSIGYYSYEEGDITITAVIPELGLRERIGPISTDDAETLSQLLVMEIPQGTPEGTYDVRFTINDDFRRVKYREITVKNECGVCPAYCRA